MKIGIIVGHKPNSPGAVNADGTSEYSFNDALANLIGYSLAQTGHEPIIIYRDTYKGLPYKVNATGVDIAVSLHCNAFNTEVSGSETLYYYKSTNGKLLAKSVNDEIVKCLCLPNRGIKPIRNKHKGSAGDKGGHLVKYTSMPCVILEPFFIDNPNDLSIANNKLHTLVESICTGICNYTNKG